ncbi:hypothetical protein IWQ60_000974 [Tieghemiomyces parasiticus]|uniref:Uncharacterized protein n=1 Tax=Tieghemiomyces parasiticus TaxID=78921 RepID=A0A9W8E2B7_9FUNG|nr:hypothetical protein IWQ60_000974 [Tieghemiomyces parasiticus]
MSAPPGPNIGTHASQFLMADDDREVLARREERYARFVQELAAQQQKAEAATARGEPVDPPTVVDLKTKALDMAVLDASNVVLAQASHALKWINVQTGDVRRIYRGHSGPVSAVMVWQRGERSAAINTPTAGTPASSRLISGSWDRSVKVWDLATGACLQTLTGHADFVKCLALAPGGAVGGHTRVSSASTAEILPILFSGSSDGSIRQWDLRDGRCVRTLRGHTRGVDALVYDSITNTLLSASSDTTIKQWCVATGQCVRDFRGHHTSVCDLQLYPVYTSIETDLARVTAWDPTTHAPADPTLMEALEDVELWSASADKTAKQWNLVTGRCMTTLTHPDVVKAVTVTEAYVITGCRDENVRIWDKATGECIKVLGGHFDEVSALAVIGGTIVSAALDASLRKWNIKKALYLPGLTYDALPPLADTAPVAAAKPVATKSLLTEEEERELAELMSDDED